MKLTRSRQLYILLILLFLTIACLSSPTPAPGEIITMDNACDFDGQVIEVAGQLILPNGVSCSTEDPITLH